MIGPEHEAVRPAGGEAFTDSVSFAFGDLESELFGAARIGLAGPARRASALALLFSGGEPAAARAEGGIDVDSPDWARIDVAGVTAAVDEPLARWRVAFAGEGAGFELTFAALGSPAELDAAAAVPRAGGLAGYEQLCRVEGTVTVGDRAREMSCLGQRGHAWGDVDWSAIELSRTVSAWLGDDRAVTLSAIRPQDARSHADEALSAFLLEAAQDGAAAQPRAVAEPRLSTTYDSEGHQRRAGLELWLTGDDEEIPRRVAGQVACGTSLDLGRLRLDSAFFQWRMEGRTGAGRYDVLRRA